MEIYTIGFTHTGAESFFGRLRRAGIQRLVDVRLKNTSQLAGFAKRDDLAFFLRELCSAEYRHEPLLAPTKDLLNAFKKGKGTWAAYAEGFQALMAERRIEERLDKQLFDAPTVLMCSEAEAEHCHRRLVAEYLKEKWGDIEVVHL